MVPSCQVSTTVTDGYCLLEGEFLPLPVTDEQFGGSLEWNHLQDLLFNDCSLLPSIPSNGAIGVLPGFSSKRLHWHITTFLHAHGVWHELVDFRHLHAITSADELTIDFHTKG